MVPNTGLESLTSGGNKDRVSVVMLERKLAGHY